NNAVFGEPLNGEFSCRPLDYWMRPAEIHTLEGLDKGAARCTGRLLRAACHEHVTKQGDLAFAASNLAAGFLIQMRAGGKLGEIGRRPHEPGVSEARGSAYGRLGPRAEPDGRSWPLYRPWGDRGVIHPVMFAMMSDVLFRPEPEKQGSALLQSAPALLERITKGGEFLRRVAGAYSQNQTTPGNHVDHRAFLGNHHRMVQRKQKNPRAQADRVGPACNGSQSDERCRIQDRIVVMLT